MKLELIKPGSFMRPPTFATIEPMDLQGHVIPVGFGTDGASIPPPLWPFLPPLGRYARAAVLHDYALKIGMLWEDAAALFYKQMIEDGVGRLRSFVLYRAVLLYGSIKH